jgi:hypothetical protein
MRGRTSATNAASLGAHARAASAGIDASGGLAASVHAAGSASSASQRDR